ncbi:MAG: ABC transporter ATP-binding protein [Kastovskya adunca ATA6-11-RM4]|jgi:iron(III) transport system ATP-binding protein|nr:ABC transporter ATP-binding protein [Kastovskya adunca ATA6-11-RM4]
MTKPATLHLEGITKHFSQMASPAVADVTLTLNQGELLALLGPSGCGKTTLLRIVAGFERPESGTVKLGERIVASPDRWVAPEQRDTGMVFQDYALFPHLDVAENVAFGLKKRQSRENSASIKERTTEAIALVGLTGLEKRYPHELSGGQQQRVALARALAPQPSLILLDEPLSNLDVQVRLRLRQEVRSILKEIGTSAIFVTHDQEEALAISDKVGVMHKGYLEQLGTPEELYTEPASRFVAKFVTQANFLPARRQGRFWETEIGCFDALDSWTAKNQIATAENAEKAELMLRAESISLYPDDTSQVVIQDRQFLGREYQYQLRTPSGRQLQARTTTETRLPIGARVQLSIANNALRVFPMDSSTLSDAQSSALSVS